MSKIICFLSYAFSKTNSLINASRELGQTTNTYMHVPCTYLDSLTNNPDVRTYGKKAAAAGICFRRRRTRLCGKASDQFPPPAGVLGSLQTGSQIDRSDRLVRPDNGQRPGSTIIVTGTWAVFVVMGLGVCIATLTLCLNITN